MKRLAGVLCSLVATAAFAQQAPAPTRSPPCTTVSLAARAAQVQQVCDDAQKAAMMRVAKIESVPAGTAGETLADYRSELQVRKKLIDMQFRTAEDICSAAAGRYSAENAVN